MAEFADLTDIAEVQTLEADVCIVGSGPAGLTLARELAGGGRRILIVESGGRRETAFANTLNEIESVGAPRVMDQSKLRNRVFGGTAATWSGRCAALDEIDYAPRAYAAHTGWPFGADEVAPNLERARAYLGLGPHVYDERAWSAFGLKRRAGSLPEGLVEQLWQFSEDEVDARDYGRFAPAFERADLPDVRVLLNATVTEIEANDARTRVTGVRVAGEGGAQASVRADTIVLAAGGIENPRLLLASRLGNDNVGRFLMDHPRVTFARYGAAEAQAVMARMGFVRGAGRNYQYGFALSPELQEREGLLNCAAWLTERRSADDPWDALKRLGAGSAHTLNDVGAVLGNAGLVAAGMFERLVRKHGVPHKITSLEFDIIAEQAPDPESRVLLSDVRDAFGVPRARLDWRLGDLEARSIARLATLAAQAMPQLGLPAPRMEDWVSDGALDRSNVRDVAHPIGATRMAADPRDGATDPQGAVHGVAGLYVAGSSVFPTAGHANPTLQIVALTIRLADWLKGCG